ncbi:metal ABC transporter substrate-binding protein [Anaerotalea alkaliphila]|uniref:Zinc ABC transporter substrate-binding protein n=1 Tax=Anaerotalea alkaliphila TaxID=2662126 RepID=A0A7X5HTM8_9FIRM|nr:metal ABC transporter substrate-binding protein [Anaerotalea alkaliphila]NDL66448.1 zinc ABC transporter substrate-binding protein [Anaerotalea alkaliphila]
MRDGRKQRKAWAAALLLGTALLLGACGRDGIAETKGGQGLQVVTTFYPLQIMAMNIVQGVEGVSVVNMTPQTAGCLHDYAPTTEDMKKLEQADVLLVNGAGLESFMEKALGQAPGVRVLVAANGIDLIMEDPHHDHGEEEEDGEDHEDHLEPNPHVWVSVSLAMRQVENIRDGLMLLDPDNAQRYGENAAAYLAKLEALRETMHARLKDLPNRKIVTFHEAFPYFAQEFGLEIVGVIQREAGSEPSARELDETIKDVRELGVKALFAEPQYPAKAAETIAAETGASLYFLDPASTGEVHPDAYIDAMTANLEVLEEALR